MQINSFSPEIQQDQQRLTKQIQELGLKVNAGQEFEVDRREIDNLLNHILSYPSSERAQLHRDSNRLGRLDLDKEEKYRRISDTDVKVEEESNRICSCCGFILQERELEVCHHSIKEINSLGISTYVFFRTIANVAILLGIMFLVYSIYSIATNIQASKMEIDGSTSNQVLSFLSISLGSKQLLSTDEKQRMYVIGAWLGCVMLIIWSVLFMWLKYYQKEDEVKILMETKTASEYSLVIEKMPTGMTIEEVQQHFTDYLARLKEKEEIYIDELKVEKYNEGKPFYFNEEEFNSKELKEVMRKYQRYRQLFISWVLQRRNRDTFSASEKHRSKKYDEYKKVMSDKQKICEDIVNKIKEEYKKKNKENKTTAFITFATNRQKNLILDYNPQDIISRLKDLIPCLRSDNRFFIERNEVVYNLKIFPAPDPEDVVWSNIGVTSCQKITRKVLTYTITLVILAISFVIVYSLSNAQVQNEGNSYLSILISLSISIINIIIIQVIQLLTKYQRDYTMTNYQTSLAIKSIVAQVLNTIFVPFMAAYFIKKNVYGPSGLISDVFILAITNSFVPPLVKLIDPYYILRLFYAKYKLQPSQKLQCHQYQLNEIVERLQFEVGYEYIYIVNLFVFTCYYVSLQPIIPLIAIIGLFFMHWAQKFSLFKRCQRPVPGTKILSTAMSQMICFGTISFSLGSLTWANFLPQPTAFEQSVPPNLLSASVAFLIFVLPYEMIFRKIFSSKRMPEVAYRANRIFFTSEYDRLNPSTAQSGIREYRQFLQAKRKELQAEKPEVKSRLTLELQLNNRPNFFKQSNNGLFMSFKKDQNEAIYNNLLNRQAQNFLTPQMIANVIMPNKLSLSRTNFRKRLPVPKLNKIKSTIPRRGYDVEETVNRECADAPSESFMIAPRVESINFDKIVAGAEQKVEEVEEIQENRDQTYFNDITNVKSYIMRPQDEKCKDSSKILAPKSKSSAAPQQINLKTNKSRFAQSILIHQKSKDDHLGGNELKRSSFRQSMIKEMSTSMRCNDQIPNRFAINAENIIPLCVDEKEDINFGESLIKFYELGDFQ